MELEVTMVSHACLKIKGEFGGLVCDPWILNEPIFDFTTWKYPAATLSPDDVLDGMDTLFITHGHEDHFHIPSLDYFPRDFKILLPEYSHHPGLRAQTIERTLRAMGFHNIRKIQPWETILLGGKTPFTHIPAAKTRSHDWENAGFVIDHPGCKLINMNDNVLDRELAQEIEDRFGAFDIGFIQYAGVSIFPGCFRMTREEMKAAVQSRRESFVNQAFMVDPMTVKTIVPHAGDFCWLDDRYYDYNWANRSTPRLFENLLKEHDPKDKSKCLLLYPGDRWGSTTGVTRHHPSIDWDHYLEDIATLKEKYQPKVDAIRQWICESDLSRLKDRTRLFLTRTQKWLCQDYVVFSACIRIEIEGSNSGFHFFVKASPETGFQILWEKGEFDADHTLFIPEDVWAGILEGKLTWGMVQWSSKHSQHVPYRLDIGKMYIWMEYYIDLMNRPPQVMIETHQYGASMEAVVPQKGVFDYILPHKLSTIRQELHPRTLSKHHVSGVRRQD